MEQWFLHQEWVGALWPHAWRILLQFTILSSILYYLYNKFIRYSHADHLVKGLFVVLILLVGFWALAQKFQFLVLEIVFRTSIQLLVIGLIVIFQPELRRILLYFGQNDWLSLNALPAKSTTLYSEPWQAVKILTDAIRFLSKSKTGALIVIEMDADETLDSHYLEMGTPIHAVMSAPLILTIFHPNTPLHDGAMVISRDNHIVSAGVLLPLTEDPNLSWRYGTRHRAAIGLTEISNAVCLVVSEETGAISLAQGGKITKLASVESLMSKLEDLYATEVEETDESDVQGIFSTPVSQLMNLARHIQGRQQGGFWSTWGKKTP
ncbi:MAG: TIGR00159 family protein [Vampirovibrio sp.]